MDLCRGGAHDAPPYPAVAAIIDRHAFGTNAICRRQIPTPDRLRRTRADVGIGPYGLS